MANTFINKKRFKIAAAAVPGADTYTAVQTFVLGSASDEFVGTIAVHIVDTGSFTGSISVKARSAHREANADAVGFAAIPYVKQHLNGSAADETYVSTAITTTSIILIPATGLEIALDLTSYTSGTATIYWQALQGAAA